MKALVIMILRRLHKVGELLAVLEEESTQMREVRQLLLEGERFPSRRTFQRRLKTPPNSLPDQIGTVTSESRKSIVDSNRFSELLDEL